MKNNVEAGSGKDQRSDNASFARLTPSRLLVGVLSITLLLLSLIGAIAVVTSTPAIAARATLATNSVTKHTLVPNKTSTPSPTPTTPSPTPTSTTAPTPISTFAASSTLSLSPTRSSNTPVATAKPGTTSTVTVSAIPAQSSGQGQTPTTPSTSNTIQSASQDQQNGNFPFIALAIGVPGTTAAIVFFFIGWWLLRKHLLPVKNVKLPPSGADPWCRVRVNDTSWNMNVNGSTQPFGSNNQLSNGPVPWGHTSVALAPYGFGQIYPQNNFAPGSQLSFNGLDQIHNAPVMPAPAKPEINGPQAMGNNYNDSYGREEDAYQQWLRNNPEGTPDINNPYFKELIKQYSDKSRAARQQKLSNTSNEQASPTRNDETWLR
jgi:hypothetical protein